MESAYEDTSKRGKMLGLAALITLIVFLVKIFQTTTLEVYQIYVIALGIAVLAYAGLAWALGRNLNKRTLLLYIPQSALLVFSEVLFIELFFFSKFDRVYEALLLIGILIILFISSYASFLMVNIFKVSSYKSIPLEQVAKTTSYILTLLVTYFLIFAVFSSEFYLVLTLLLLVVVSFVAAVSHIMHLRFSRRLFRISVLVTVLNMFICAVASMFMGSRYEIISVAPTVALFASIALVVNSEEKKLNWLVVFEYIMFIFASFALNYLV